MFAARATTGGYLAESFLHSSRTSRQIRAERREPLGCWRSSWNNSSTSAYSDGIGIDEDDDDDNDNDDDSVTMRAGWLTGMKEHIITHHLPRWASAGKCFDTASRCCAMRSMEPSLVPVQ